MLSLSIVTGLTVLTETGERQNGKQVSANIKNLSAYTYPAHLSGGALESLQYWLHFFQWESSTGIKREGRHSESEPWLKTRRGGGKGYTQKRTAIPRVRTWPETDMGPAASCACKDSQQSYSDQTLGVWTCIKVKTMTTDGPGSRHHTEWEGQKATSLGAGAEKDVLETGEVRWELTKSDNT